MRTASQIVLLLLCCLLSAAGWAQSSKRSVIIAAQSRADLPARSGEAATLATYLEDKLESQLLKAYPCAKVTDDKILHQFLQWEKAHELLDPNYWANMDAVAGAAGARYLIVVNVTQTGAKDYLQVSCLDTVTGKAVEKQDKLTNGGDDALDGAEALASSFADSLGSLLATKGADGPARVPQNGERVPMGTPIQLTCSCEGNLCSWWPIPDGFPNGFVVAKKTITSYLAPGSRDGGVWQDWTILAGTAVSEQWEGGKCVKVDTGGAQTKAPAPTVVRVNAPGEYHLQVRTLDVASRADCGGSGPCGAGTLLRSSNTSQDRYFTVEGCPAR